ncbi:hypothetical protein HPP92_024798 [Vanilla planifolia]|uniref:Rho-GAP domain-containing protein n=1 Tax=Vanilla planifolia TaxID=51239 RepID=A0A835PNM6_VANPL|nr:hypothetical protein HPP92_024798 [Vanilla planifolia]
MCGCENWTKALTVLFLMVVMGELSTLKGLPAATSLNSLDQCLDHVDPMLVLLILQSLVRSWMPLHLYIFRIGIKVGHLRQSADVEEVMRRFKLMPLLVICICSVLEMPSSPVRHLAHRMDAYRADYVSRIDAIRDAIHEVFPEPNRRLIQRILQMMLTVAAHKAENRMSLSALAAYGSFQLLQAAAAANHAQAIVIIFLEEYDKIFDDDLSQDESSSELYTESEDDEDAEDEESTASGIPFDDRYGDVENEPKAARKVDPDCFCDGTPSASEVGSDIISEDGSYLGTDVSSNIGSGGDSNTGSNVASNACSDIGSVHSKAGSMANSDVGSDVADENSTTNSIRVSTSLTEHIDVKPSKSIGVSPSRRHVLCCCQCTKDSDLHRENVNLTCPLRKKSNESSGSLLLADATNWRINTLPSASGVKNFTGASYELQPALRNKWGRTSARKNLSMESIEYISDDESAIMRLESTKIDLQTKVSKEIEGNAALWESLDRRKETLHECRMALEKEVERLQEQLQKERDLRSYLEFGLTNMLPAHMSSFLDSKTRSDLEEISVMEREIITLKQNIADLSDQLQQGLCTICKSCGQPIYKRNKIGENAENTAVTLVADNPFKHEDVSQSVAFENPKDCSFLSTRESSSSSNNNRESASKRNMAFQDGDSLSNDELACEPDESRDELRYDGLNAAYQANLDDMGRKAQGKQHLVVQEQCSSNEEAAVERTTATVENSQLAEGNEDTKLQFEEPRSLANNQASEKGKARLVKHSSSRSSVCIAASSPEDQCSASKKNAKFSSMKKDILDSPLDNKSYQKKRLSSLHLKSEKSTDANSTAAVEEKVTLVRNNATRRPAPKNEEVATSSSALAKLTNRLNFLKERRLQLANELQDLDVGRNFGSEPPSRTNSS